MNDLSPAEMRFIRAFRVLDPSERVFISDLTYSCAADRKSERPCLRLVHTQQPVIAASGKEAQA